MPSPEEILGGLREITNHWRMLAILWHVYFGVFALGLILGVRPSKRAAGVLLALPCLSVSAVAWAAGNPFNGTFFELSGIALLAVSMRMPSGRVRISPLQTALPGAAMFIFGWIYPHFLEGSSMWAYLYSAPTGLIPCPTLSIIIGLALVLRGLESRAWSIIIGATGIFYGLFGAARLGVAIDWVLLGGAVVIVLVALAGRARSKMVRIARMR
jgi:hypothetical protein